jgi:hypothetical protein
MRDSQWRIKTIPWWPEGEYQKMYSHPLSSIMAILGLLLFFATIVLVFKQWIPVWGISFCVLGAAILIASNYVAAHFKYKHWVQIEAKVCDLESREVEVHTGNGKNQRRKKVWAFRILCEFEYGDKTYQVTPDINRHFKTQEQLLQHLKETIGDDKLAPLWINPNNPLETAYEFKPRHLKH